MSFRTEDKFYLNPEDKMKINKFFTANGVKKIFPDRIIVSLYFDTDNLDMFCDSEEGTTPRKKIRIRQYNKLKKFDIESKESLFEIKINSVEGKFKTSKKISNVKKLIKFGYLDDMYGICMPKLFTFYKRSYYSLNNNRFTMDREMCFKNFNDKGKLLKNFYNLVICEVKSKSSLYNDYLRYLPISNIRYSKYCEAVRHLNLHA